MAHTVNQLGTITISDEVLAILAGYSAEQCYGIVDMVNKTASDGLAHLFNIENPKRGIRIIPEEDGSISVDLFIRVKYGVSIVTVANNAIDFVRYNMEENTGIKVKKVNVTVEGVQL